MRAPDAIAEAPYRRGGRRWSATGRGLLLRVCVAFCCTLSPAQGLAQESGGEPLLEPEDALYAGGFLLATLALAPVDVAIAEAIQAERFQDDGLFSATAGVARFLGIPGSLIVSGGLYAGGLLAADPELADAGLHTAGAILLSSAVTFTAKGLIGRARPRTGVDEPFRFGFGRGFTSYDYRSFPSGHTTAAFATAAALVTEVGMHEPELRGWVGVALYGAAALVGVSRMYHNEHWASDVVAGAAIGTFGGWKFVRWAHSHPNNELDRLFLAELEQHDEPRVTLHWTVAVP